jgi:hypothetical protein
MFTASFKERFLPRPGAAGLSARPPHFARPPGCKTKEREDAARPKIIILRCLHGGSIRKEFEFHGLA